MDRPASGKTRRRQQARAARLSHLAGQDLCACGSTLRCEGPCREAHTRGGRVGCPEVYRLGAPGPRRWSREQRA